MGLSIGIIGFGAFGKLAAEHLSRKADVSVTDVVDKSEEAKKLGVEFASLEEVTCRDVVILSVPMDSLEDVLHKIKDKVKEGGLVLDVCSLKSFSCSLMKDVLPDSVDIVGTHPLFGPQSASDSIKGMKIALCDVRGDRISEVKDFCEDLGLNVFKTTPKEHDRQMAFSQALTHFIGQVANRMGIKRVRFSTKTFDDLMDIIDIIKDDKWRLFENIQSMNPFAGEVRDEFIEESIELNEYLEEL